MIEDHDGIQFRDRNAMAEELAKVDFPYESIDKEPTVEEAAEIFREAARTAMDFYRTVFMRIVDFKGDKNFALDCAMLALGWYDLARAYTQEDIAKRYKCERANVNRLVNKIQKNVGIPPMDGQRGQSAREKFSTARKKQLKQNNECKN